MAKRGATLSASAPVQAVSNPKCPDADVRAITTNADLIAGDLVGQKLAHPPLQTFPIARFAALTQGGALSEQRLGLLSLR